MEEYCELIINNLKTRREKYKTQLHHILPRCYFNLISQEIDNSISNKINLLYKDHILAHYYLCLCTNGNLKYKLSNAFFHLVNRKWRYEDFNPETDLDEYQKIYEEFVKNLSNDEERKLKISKNRTGIKHTEEELLKMRNRSTSQKVKDTVKLLRSKRVQNLETGDVYESVTSAEIILCGKPTSNIGMSAYNLGKGINRTAYGYHWVYLETNNNIPYTQEERIKILNNLPNHKVKRIINGKFTFPLYCFELNKTICYVEELKSLVSLKAWGINKILDHCDNKFFNNILFNYHWSYLKDRLDLIDELNK